MPFTSGAISLTSSSATSIVLAGAVATGGSGTYTYQWLRSTDGGSTWSNIGGATTAAAVTDSSVTNNAGYYYRLQSKDTGVSPNLTVDSNTVYALATTVNSASLPELSVGGVYNSSAPTLTSGQSSELQLDVNGNLKTTGGGSSSNASVGTTGTTAPTSATEVGGIDAGGLLQPISTLNYGTGLNALVTASGPTVFTHSTANSSTAQLGAGATFTGTIETVFTSQNISILLTSDQPVTLVMNQYIDLAGTRKANTLTFTVAANAGFARSFVLNGNYLNITAQNTGGSTTTTFNLDVAYGNIMPVTNLGNLPVSIAETGTTVPVSGSLSFSQNNVISSVNSSTATLTANSVFTGTSESSLAYGSISIEAFSDQASAAGGLQIQQSQDGTNWDIVDPYSVVASTSFQTTVSMVGQFFRVVYTNGGTNQSTFRLQTVKIVMNPAAPRSLGQKTSASSIPVVISSDQSAVPISAASLPLPTGGSTSALQTTGNTSLSSIATNTAVGATSANQTNGTQQSKITDGTNISNVIAADTGSNGLVTAFGFKSVGGGLQTWSGTGTTLALAAIDTLGFKSYRLHVISTGTGVTSLSVQTADVQSSEAFITQQGVNVNSGVAATTAGTGNVAVGNINGRWLQIISNANQTAGSTTYYLSLSMAPLPTQVTISGSVTASSVTGNAASGATISGNPLAVGLRAVNAEPTAVTNGQAVYQSSDLVGKAIVMPYANKENFVSGNATTTGTSDTSVIAAGGAGLKNYITGGTVSNTGATTSGILIKSGSGGATIGTTIAPAGAGSNFTFPTPIFTAAATAAYFTAASASTTISITLTGYIGT